MHDADNTVVTIVGARPQFVKAAVTSAALARAGWKERIVHTGQHYDARLSQVFFDELGIPEPAHRLQVGSASHGRQTGAMLAAIEGVLEQEQPRVVLVFGDTNSTLAGALAAAKMHIPVAHVEAGLRSFNRRMPEEINRVLTGHVASLHFCPTQAAVAHLTREGITRGVHLVGDVMLDCVRRFREIADRRSEILEQLGLASGRFILMTCHRAENTDDPQRLAAIMGAARKLAVELPVVLPLHPRTKARIEQLGAEAASRLTVIDPIAYLDMLKLESHAAAVLTDSGGVQKEAFFLGTPCITLREETEWPETVESGLNRLAGADEAAILAAAIAALENETAGADAASAYGDGRAATKIADILCEALGGQSSSLAAAAAGVE